MTRGVMLAEELLKRELFNQGLHKAECKRFKELLSTATDLHLNLGCGSKLKQGWCNVDLMTKSADFRLDLREPWPFGSGSAKTVYSEHFFEHLDYPLETAHFINESHRVLQPGGMLHIGVPGTAWLMRSYGDSSSLYWKLAKTIWHPAICRTWMHHINHHFRQEGQHKYAWDLETLLDVLRENGFQHPAKRPWNSFLDSDDRRVNTLYAVARKT
jgi:predicted SAM-dependent methyltransferase